MPKNTVKPYEDEIYSSQENINPICVDLSSYSMKSFQHPSFGNEENIDRNVIFVDSNVENYKPSSFQNNFDDEIQLNNEPHISHNNANEFEDQQNKKLQIHIVNQIHGSELEIGSSHSRIPLREVSQIREDIHMENYEDDDMSISSSEYYNLIPNSQFEDSLEEEQFNEFQENNVSIENNIESNNELNNLFNNQIDMEDINDVKPSFALIYDNHPVSEYADSIVETFYDRELRGRPTSNYINFQPELTREMREILVDWLVDVSIEFQLENRTVHFAIDYIDRFLSQHPVSRSRLQLCGITALWIASKYNEQNPQPLDDFVFITNNTYTRDELIEMESVMLNSLQFTMSSVIQLDFIELYLRVTEIDYLNVNYNTLYSLVEYLSELTLHSYDMIQYVPSKIIASCIIVALHTLGIQIWTPKMQYYIQYSAQDLANSTQDVYRLFHFQYFFQTKLLALRDKFSTVPFNNVSRISPLDSNPVEELLRIANSIA